MPISSTRESGKYRPEFREDLDNNYTKSKAIPTKKIILLYANAHGCVGKKTKLQELSTVGLLVKADLILVTESGMDLDSLPDIKGFNKAAHCAKPPEHSKSGKPLFGGCAIWINSKSNLKILYTKTNNKIQLLQTITVNTNYIKLLLLYRSPSQKGEIIAKASEEMNKHFTEHADEDYIIIGDLNAPDACWATNTYPSNPHMNSMIKALVPDHKHQIVNIPTKKRKPNEKKANILDVVISDKTTPTSFELLVNNTPEKLDHYLMKIDIICPEIEDKDNEFNSYYICHRLTNWDNFRSILIDVDWSVINNFNVEMMLDFICIRLQRAHQKSIQYKRRTIINISCMQKQALHIAKSLKSDSLSKRKRKKLNQEINQIHLDIKKFEARRQAL